MCLNACAVRQNRSQPFQKDGSRSQLHSHAYATPIVESRYLELLNLHLALRFRHQQLPNVKPICPKCQHLKQGMIGTTSSNDKDHFERWHRARRFTIGNHHAGILGMIACFYS